MGERIMVHHTVKNGCTIQMGPYQNVGVARDVAKAQSSRCGHLASVVIGGRKMAGTYVAGRLWKPKAAEIGGKADG